MVLDKEVGGEINKTAIFIKVQKMKSLKSIKIQNMFIFWCILEIIPFMKMT